MSTSVKEPKWNVVSISLITDSQIQFESEHPYNPFKQCNELIEPFRQQQIRPLRKRDGAQNVLNLRTSTPLNSS